MPFFSVNYNDLAENPKGTLEKICLVLNMPYFDGKERFWEKPHHYLFGSGGILKQFDTRTSTIEYRKEFPEEFNAAWEQYKRRLVNDIEVRETIEMLKQKDVSIISVNTLESSPVVSKKLFLPAWYYRKKLIRRIRRIFPEKYEPDEFASVEYVP